MRTSRMSTSTSIALLLLASTSRAQQADHVVELHSSSDVQAEALVDVFKSFGVAEAQSTQLIAKVAEKGKAIVIAGPKDACEGASKQFEAVGMKATVRLLTKADRPSEYADSDVIDADGAQFQALMNDPSAGALVREQDLTPRPARAPSSPFSSQHKGCQPIQPPCC